MSDFKSIIEQIDKEDVNNKQRISDDLELYLIYNGQLRKQIVDMIYKEFSEPKTIVELKNRICPINITKKIIDKLSKVYKQQPIRSSTLNDESDNELIAMYEKTFNINTNMAMANRMFKLNKHVLTVPYLDKNGIPRLRIIPSHSFSLFSDDKINPEKPTQILIHINTKDKEPEKNRYQLWSDTNFWIIDDNGAVVTSEMQELNNPEGINYYKVLPHTHITQQRELLYPIRSSDIKSIQYAVCLLLSDSCLAQKYLSWATLVISGSEGEKKVSIGPGAVLDLPKLADGTSPTAQYLQPQLNSDEVIRLVDKLIEDLLITNNISAGSLMGALQAGNIPGVSKILDSSESTEDIGEQQKYFIDAEQEMWDKFAHNILPYWVSSNQIDPDYAGAFSPEFELSISFPEIKPMLSEAERIDNAKAKLDAGFITERKAIKEVSPELSDEDVDQLIMDIKKEKADNMAFFERNMPEQMNQENNGNQTTQA